MSRTGIALIGGAGFIGTHLTRRLLASGWDVRIVDLLPSPHWPERTIIADVTDRGRLMRALAGCESVCNLAAEHRDDVRPVGRYFEVNVGGARTLCSAMGELGIGRLLFISSVAVYRSGREEATETSICAPITPYGRSKLEAEAIYRDWAQSQGGRSLSIIRPTVVFGEGNRGNLYSLWRQIERRRFAMVGSGRNRKSMAYVGNLVALLERCLDLGGITTFNYADKPDLTTRELVAILCRLVGRTRTPIAIPYPIGYLGGLLFDLLSLLSGRSLPISAQRIRKFCADTRFGSSRLEGIGFRPPVSLTEGLGRTVAARFGSEE